MTPEKNIVTLSLTLTAERERKEEKNDYRDRL